MPLLLNAAALALRLDRLLADAYEPIQLKPQQTRQFVCRTCRTERPTHQPGCVVAVIEALRASLV